MTGISPAYRKIQNAPAITAVQNIAKKDMQIMTDIDGLIEGITKSTVRTKRIEEDIEIRIGHFPAVKINPQTRKLLDILLMRVSEVVSYGEDATRINLAMPSCITVRLDEFMSLFGVSDEKNAREQLRQAASTLMNIYVKIDYTVEKKKRGKPVKEHKKVDSYMFEATVEIRNLTEDTVHNSRTEFRFNLTVLEYLCNRFVMPVNIKMFTINPQKNPHSYNIMRKLTEHYDMNATAPDKPVRISVRSMLEYCPEIPTPEEVNDRHQAQLIKAPFERDLEALEETYGLINLMGYCKRGGVKIEPEETQPADYSFEDWLDLLIEYYLPDYPVKKAKELRRRKKEQTA